MKATLKSTPKLDMDLVTFVVAALAMISTLFSCAPKIEEKQSPVFVIASGPRFLDKNLQNSKGTAFADKYFSANKVVDNKDQLENLEFIENHFSIAQISNSSLWKKKALQSYSKFNSENKFLELTAENSVYLDIVEKQIGTLVNSSVTAADTQLQKDVELVSATVREQQAEHLQITLESTLAEKLVRTASFIEKVTAKIETLEIMPEFKILFIEQMKVKSSELITKAQNLDQQLASTTTLEDAIQHIDLYVTESKTELNPEDAADLADGRDLAKKVSATKNAKAGLAAIAMVWIILEPEQRKEMIKPENAELYKFFSEKGPRDIQCLAERSCDSLITKIVLNVGVYPAIESYGISNLRNTLNQKSRDFVIAKVNQVAFDSLTTLSETIIAEVASAVAMKRAELQTFDKNLNSVLKKNWTNYLTTKSISGMQSHLLTAENETAPVKAQSLVIRNQLSTFSEPADFNQSVKLQFEVLEHILRFPEFTRAAFTDKENQPMSLVGLILEPQPRQYINAKNGDTVTLADQTAALLTTAKAIRELSDWKTSSFDNNLSAIQAQEVITEFKVAALEKPLFAKGDLLALAISVASQTLKLIEDVNSPLILIDNNQKIVLVQDFNDDSAPLALAAATDFVNGERSPIVKAVDLSQFQMALIEFYMATAGLEKTASSVLREEAADKVSLLNQILAARKKIKTVVIAIGNFLSNQMMQKNGLVKNQFLLSMDQIITADVTSLQEFQSADQAAAIEALVRTYEMTDIDVYLWSALDIYYSMNQNLFDAKLKFYTMSSKDTISKVELTTTYKNLLRLKPYLSAESQIQLESIFYGWLQNI